MNTMKPLLLPKNMNFSSGPCAKIPKWKSELLQNASIGRTHRADVCVEKFNQIISLTKELLQIPDDYLLGILAGSATGAMETAIWNLLGANPLTILVHDVFGDRWLHDVEQELKITNLEIRKVNHGLLPDTKNIPLNNDILLNWNGSSSGVQFPNADFIDHNRTGLVIADVTSYVFTGEIPWNKFDAIAFSWQKGLGSEGAHGMLALSPRAIERIKTYTPSWAIPYLFRIKAKGNVVQDIFSGKVLNTPSMLCAEDYLQSLNWAQQQGGLNKLIAKSKNNLSMVRKWVKDRKWIEFLAQEYEQQSSATICLSIIDEQFINKTKAEQNTILCNIEQYFAQNKIGYDILNHPKSGVPSFRIWGGPTVDSEDINRLLAWLDFIWHKLCNNNFVLP